MCLWNIEWSYISIFPWTPKTHGKMKVLKPQYMDYKGCGFPWFQEYLTVYTSSCPFTMFYAWQPFSVYTTQGFKPQCRNISHINRAGRRSDLVTHLLLQFLLRHSCRKNRFNKTHSTHIEDNCKGYKLNRL